MLRTGFLAPVGQPRFFRAPSRIAHSEASTVSAPAVSDDLSQVPRISLEEFYSTVENFKLSDEEALSYMNFAAKMAMVTFKD